MFPNIPSLLYFSTLVCLSWAGEGEGREGTQAKRDSQPQGPSYTLTLIVNDACKVVDPKLGLVIVLGGNVVRVELVLGVELMQHGGVRALWEPRSTHQALLLLPAPLSTRPYCLSCPLSFHPLLSFPRASLPLFISQYRSSLGLHFPICEVGELELQNLESTSQYRKSISQD